MPARQPLPRAWLVTDERHGDEFLPAVERLPFGSGILFRHYSLAEGERGALFRDVRTVARRRGHLLLLAGTPTLARRWGADGWHGRGRGGGLHSASVHDLAEVRAAERAGASILFVSPIYPTRSHPGSPTLGEDGFARLAHRTELPVIALGGMNRNRARRLMALGAYGWAAVDAWLA
ncbi:MAG: thiamine phosphate synthase [Allosphingosinicella sp.]|uniref:thiamine phosphate synthase n=1 Tax=Allosphingosinicella sp. TaxID=2823234 RepID=UPI00393CC8FA